MISNWLVTSWRLTGRLHGLLGSYVSAWFKMALCDRRVRMWMFKGMLYIIAWHPSLPRPLWPESTSFVSKRRGVIRHDTGCQTFAITLKTFKNMYWRSFHVLNFSFGLSQKPQKLYTYFSLWKMNGSVKCLAAVTLYLQSGTAFYCFFALLF